MGEHVQVQGAHKLSGLAASEPGIALSGIGVVATRLQLRLYYANCIFFMAVGTTSFKVTVSLKVRQTSEKRAARVRLVG